jgi:hypothetical protein
MNDSDKDLFARMAFNPDDIKDYVDIVSDSDSEDDTPVKSPKSANEDDEI